MLTAEAALTQRVSASHHMTPGSFAGNTLSPRTPTFTFAALYRLTNAVLNLIVC